MDTAIIAALIGGTFAILAAFIAAVVSIYQKRKDKNTVIKVELTEKINNIPSPSPPKNSKFLNPNKTVFGSEDYFVTLGAYLQQSRNSSDVNLKKIEKPKDVDANNEKFYS